MEDQESEQTKPLSRNHRIIKYSLGAVAILIGVGFVVAIAVVVILYYTPSTPVTNENPTTGQISTTTSATEMITAMNIFDYLPQANEDGLNIRFSHSVNEEKYLVSVLQENNSAAIEGDACVKYYGTPSQNDSFPLMAEPPVLISDLTLEQWLNSVIPTRWVMKLDLTVDVVVPIVFQAISERIATIQQPVWINLEVVNGPNANQNPVDFDQFLRHMNEIFPHVTVSLGWTNAVSLSEQPQFTWAMMDEMLEKMKKVSQRVVICGRASLVRNSWDKFLWLLEQSDDYWLTVYDQPLDVVQVEDVAFVRDNTEHSRVFYDIMNETRQALDALLATASRTRSFYSGGNVLEYFRIPNRNAYEVTWAHRVVEKAHLESILNSDSILMLETDIQLYGAGTSRENKSLPVMAHDPPAFNYELTFEEWMRVVIESNKTKGIKLDFKSIDAMEASLPILSRLQPELKMPIWINSDVKRGPNSVTRPRNATLFFSLIQQLFPHVTLSPGWTTTYRPTGNNEFYTQAMVEEMYTSCSGMRQAITFPVRASLARPSIPQFQWLLEQSNRYTLTLWHSTSEIVLVSDLVEIYNSFPVSKVYYDLPEDIMNEFLEAIST